jgi:hypothetical protein
VKSEVLEVRRCQLVDYQNQLFEEFEAKKRKKEKKKEYVFHKK